jgi:hypothetical protein
MHLHALFIILLFGSLRMSLPTSRITLVRGEQRQEVQINQINVENLRRLFQVDPNDVWLRDDLDLEAAYLPGDDGSFNFPDDVNITSLTTLMVEGRSSTETTVTPRSAMHTMQRSLVVPSTPVSTSGGVQSGSSVPLFRSVTSKRSTTSSYIVKIIKANMTKNHKGKPDFEPLSQTFISLVEATANLDYILTTMQRRWGQDYRVVTGDGIELEDSPATQGLAFWKCPRRKLYAVSYSDLNARISKRQHHQVVISDSEEDDIQPQRKSSAIQVQDLKKIQDDIAAIKGDISEINSLSANSKIPLALNRILKETFKCSICHAVPTRPPVIIMKCCKSIAGCEGCVNNWFSGEDALTKTCPLCRAERAYCEVMILRGLDDFLAQVKNALQDQDQD